MALEKYAVARERLLRELKGKGWKTSKPDLKITWAEPPSRDYKIWFRAQAIYQDEHSTFLEMRGLKVDYLIHWLKSP